MTPKQKADSLIAEFRQDHLDVKTAKKMALKTAVEVIKVLVKNVGCSIDLEYWNNVASEIVKPINTNWLSIAECAAMYGKEVEYKQLSPDGNGWLNRKGKVNSNILREMEQGSIKEILKL